MPGPDLRASHHRVTSYQLASAVDRVGVCPPAGCGTGAERVEQLDVAGVHPLVHPHRCRVRNESATSLTIARPASSRSAKIRRPRGPAWHLRDGRVVAVEGHHRAPTLCLDPVPERATGATAVREDLLVDARAPGSCRLRLSMNATASSTARTKWPFPWWSVKPLNTPRASGSYSGLKAPARWGSISSPSAPGGTAAASAVS